MKTSFVFSGSGGQGIMSAGITLAHTAIDMGKHATFLPEYGPEQRGGSAKCTVVVDDDPIVSPLPRVCDNLILLNEVKETGLSTPQRARANEFMNELVSRGVNATIRRRLGSDINASCGQLRLSRQKGADPSSGDKSSAQSAE